VKIASFLLTAVGILFFITALVFACLPSAAVTRLSKRFMNRDKRRL
jgi:hypothetical protein